jgi:hypothetical protein
LAQFWKTLGHQYTSQNASLPSPQANPIPIPTDDSTHHQTRTGAQKGICSSLETAIFRVLCLIFGHFLFVGPYFLCKRFIFMEMTSPQKATKTRSPPPPA